ncbi:hypothetical protein BDF19DRAFT_438778 [Syncephalis fuscata]|nr:hypothetical protein BDF19DRAFT_438778 [Syncephalis fuscata]
MLSTMLKNATITLYSIGVPHLARAGNLGMMLSDANILFKEQNVKLADWRTTREQLQKTASEHADNNLSTSGAPNPYGAAPTLEINGQWYAQTVPIMRLLARELGEYDGNDSYEKYLVDAVADLAIDWRTDWVKQYWSKDKEIIQRYNERGRPRFIEAIQDYLQRRNGTYLLGERISYADILLYSLVYDETPEVCKLNNDSPLYKLYKAVGERPRIAAYVNNWKLNKL